MILGIYWYYRFPEGLYHLDFFRFSRGLGGYANNPAELSTRVSVENIESCLHKIKKIKSEYEKIFLTLKSNENQLLIKTGDFNLYDYHFQLVSEIEEILKSENAVVIDDKISFEEKEDHSFEGDWTGVFSSKKHDFIQLIGSDFKKYNAENFSLRIDCHLPLSHKKDFIIALKEICRDENISVFYYKDFELEYDVNLMLFFTNGRQTKDNIQIVDINSFGYKIQNITKEYRVEFKHEGDFNFYPLNGPHVQLMKDKEFIINEKY